MQMSTKYKCYIDWCTYKAALYACKTWHYSKSMPAGKCVKIGLWEDDIFFGCLIFSLGANNNIGKTYGLKLTEVCELTRIALRKGHKTQVSKLISFSIKILRKIHTKLRLIISYADIDQGHIGAVYQASNWIYVGIMMENKPDGSYVINGQRIHGRTLSCSIKRSSKEITRDQFVRNIDSNAKKFVTKGKHKYLMTIDSEMLCLAQKSRKDYPRVSHNSSAL